MRVYEALERAARMRGVLVVSTPGGGVVLTRAGGRATKTVLRQGVNILRASLQTSLRERFSDYTVVSQSAGSDERFGMDSSEPHGAAEDKGVRRHRPLVLMAEDQGLDEELQKRAVWECNVRAGRSRRYSCTVRGWLDEEGRVWAPNTMACVEDDWLGIHARLLVSSVVLQKDKEGTTAALELVARETFDVLATPETDGDQ